MIKSMTGFGRCEKVTEEYKLSVEILIRSKKKLPFKKIIAITSAEYRKNTGVCAVRPAGRGLTATGFAIEIQETTEETETA